MHEQLPKQSNLLPSTLGTRVLLFAPKASSVSQSVGERSLTQRGIFISCCSRSRVGQIL
jgi:hypothetical protein